MGAFSDYLETKILEATLENIAFPTIANAYVALFTAAPSDAGGGTEVTGGSYVRKQTVAADWTVDTVGHSQNALDLTFVTATAVWGLLTHFALFDASTAGNMLYHGILTAPQQINNGGVAKFLAGQLIIDLA